MMGENKSVMGENEGKRSKTIGEALEPLMEPGDVALVVGKDDSCTLLFGKDYRDAYVEGTLTPGKAFPSVMLGMKILGEFLTGQMHLCLPAVAGDVNTLQLTKERIEAFKVAQRSGVLTPDVTFPMVAGAYQQLAVVLEGHMAACMPNEYRKIVEQMKAAPSQRLWQSTGGGKPS